MAQYSHMRSFLLLGSLCSANALCPAARDCLASETCSALPLPPSANPSAVADQGYNVTQIRHGVYSYFDGTYFSVIIYDNARLVLIDFPGPASPSFGTQSYLLTNATRDVLDGETPTKVDMIYGHRHTDHIGGAGLYMDFLTSEFPDVPTTVWGTSETAELLGRDTVSGIPGVDQIIEASGATLFIGYCLTLKLIVVGGHTQSDIAAHVLPSAGEDGVVHYVDVVNPGAVPFTDFGVSEDVFEYIAAQKAILELSFGTFSAGHVRLVTKDDIRKNLVYVEDVMQKTKDATNEVMDEVLDEAGVGVVSDPSAPEYRNSYYALKLMFDLVIDICSKRLIERSGCELAAVDLYAASHCQTAYIYNLVDRQ